MQYQSFLEAVASIENAKSITFESAEFLEYQAIFWKWPDLAKYKDSLFQKKDIRIGYIYVKRIDQFQEVQHF